MPTPVFSSEILSSLIDISKANIFLLPKTFYDLGEEEEFLKSPNIL